MSLKSCCDSLQKEIDVAAEGERSLSPAVPRHLGSGDARHGRNGQRWLKQTLVSAQSALPSTGSVQLLRVCHSCGSLSRGLCCRLWQVYVRVHLPGRVYG